MIKPHFLRLLITLQLILLMLCLTSCSHLDEDGPPPFYVDETKIPNAIPKPEPLAKYGNMRTYMVNGKQYNVLPTSKNYQAIGFASWYGTKFHAQRTSSGEPYNMLSMTAAHKTLPLPTYVEVTNLANHRQIVVKVNDRGPFLGNRLLDLSYVAAKKLGMLGKGTTLVKIRAMDPYVTLSPQPSVHPLNTSHPFYWQVGAFKNIVNAEKLKQYLLKLKYAPVHIIFPSNINELYRVQLGPFNDMTTATKIAESLEMIGLRPSRG